MYYDKLSKRDRQALDEGWQFCLNCEKDNIECDYYKCPNCDSEELVSTIWIPEKKEYYYWE